MKLRTVRYLLVIGLTLGAVSEWATAQQEETKTAPRLEAENLEWDFGTVWQGEPLEHIVTLKNVGDAPLEITEVKSSCGCTTPSKPKSPLMPGESDKLTVSYNSKSKMGKANQTITLTTNDPQQARVIVRVRGEVKPCYELKPKSGVMFGSLLSSTRETRTVEIRNLYDQPLSLEVKAEQDTSPYELKLKEVEEGQLFELAVSTVPPLPVGTVQTSIKLATNLERYPELPITVFGFVPSPVKVTPASLFWPKNSVMEMKYTLWVSHAPDHPIKVLGATANHESIKVTVAGDDADPGAKGQIKVLVTLPPGNRLPDDVEPSIEIQTDAKGTSFETISVPVKVVIPRSHS